MSYDLMILGVAVGDGLLAQRKLDGDTSIIAPDAHDHLQAIVSQGKSAEGILRQAGDKGRHFLKQAYERGGVAYAGQD
jgi:hypothetical protein